MTFKETAKINLEKGEKVSDVALGWAYNEIMDELEPKIREALPDLVFRDRVETDDQYDREDIELDIVVTPMKQVLRLQDLLSRASREIGTPSGKKLVEAMQHELSVIIVK